MFVSSPAAEVTNCCVVHAAGRSRAGTHWVQKHQEKAWSNLTSAWCQQLLLVTVLPRCPLAQGCWGHLWAELLLACPVQHRSCGCCQKQSQEKGLAHRALLLLQKCHLAAVSTGKSIFLPLARPLPTAHPCPAKAAF